MVGMPGRNGWFIFGLSVTVWWFGACTHSQIATTLVDADDVWNYYYAPAYNYAPSLPYFVAGPRDERFLSLFKKGWSGGDTKKVSGWRGWLPKKSFGVHVKGGVGFSFGGKEEKKEEEKPQGYGWGAYHNQGSSHGQGWGSYHKPTSHGWGSYHHHSPSYGWSDYDDAQDDDASEKSDLVEDVDVDEDELEQPLMVQAAESDPRPRLLLLDNIYGDEAPYLYSEEYDDYY